MQKITWTWKKILSLICGFLGIGTLVSCYGVPMGPRMEEPIDRLEGTVYGDIDGDYEKEPVPGMKVSLEAYEEGFIAETTTDDLGFFSLEFEPHFCSDLTLFFEDVDGEENGSFSDGHLHVRNDYHDIFLYRKVEEPAPDSEPAPETE